MRLMEEKSLNRSQRPAPLTPLLVNKNVILESCSVLSQLWQGMKSVRPWTAKISGNTQKSLSENQLSGKLTLCPKIDVEKEMLCREVEHTPRGMQRGFKAT